MAANRLSALKASIYSIVLGSVLVVSPVMASDYVGDGCFRVEYSTGEVSQRDPSTGETTTSIIYLPDNEFLYKIASHSQGMGLYDLHGYMIDLLHPNELHRVELKATILGGKMLWERVWDTSTFDRNTEERIHYRDTQSLLLGGSKWTTDITLNGEAYLEWAYGYYDNDSGQIISREEHQRLEDELYDLPSSPERSAAFNERYDEFNNARGTVELIPCSEFPKI